MESYEKDDGMCARSDVMLDGEISKRVDVLQGVAQGCTLSSNSSKVSSDDLILRGAIVNRTKFCQ